MSNLQLRKEVRDGIEFFVSVDSEVAGISQMGLATFNGVGMTAIKKVLDAYINFTKLPSETIEAARSKGLTIYTIPNPNYGKDVRFIPAELCEAVTFYYAFESEHISKDARDHARKSYRKFAAIGIKTWILQVTGYHLAPTTDPVLDSEAVRELGTVLKHLLGEVKELRQRGEKYYNIKDSIQHQPGLNEIVSTYEQGHLLSDGQQFTLQTWLRAKGLVLSHGMMVKFGLLVGQTYHAHHRRPAPKMRGDLLGNKGFGLVNVYSTEDLPILESVLKTCIIDSPD